MLRKEDSPGYQSDLSFCGRSKVLRSAQRASYDRQKAYGLIDQLKTGHIAFVEAGEPRSIPITLWRWRDDLYFHALKGGRLSRILAASAIDQSVKASAKVPCPEESASERSDPKKSASRLLCISFAQTTEWVMSKSAFHHSANYQSVVLYGRATEVTEKDDFNQAFKAIINLLEPGRWEHIREPSDKERKATALFRLPIEEGAFKSRTGGPNEEPEDMSLPVWHGTLPVSA